MRDPEARRRLLAALSREVSDQRVLDAMATVPREAFVMPEDAERAYENVPLPIGEGQTISQPLIVAMMIEALDLSPADRVLEVGTGSGYQAALLSRLAATLVTVERIAPFVEHAEEVLEAQGYHNVTVHLAGEALGWPQRGPYDAIIVAAAAPSIPDVLVQQLGLGGRQVMPVGSPFEQQLVRVRRANGGLEVKALGGCRFVPLIGKDAWEPEDGADGPLASV